VADALPGQPDSGWFLHSRTLLRQRLGRRLLLVFVPLRQLPPEGRRWLIPALAAGALAFYSYSPSNWWFYSAVQPFTEDWHYHFAVPKAGGEVWLHCCFLAAPYLFFRFTPLKHLGITCASCFLLGQRHQPDEKYTLSLALAQWFHPLFMVLPERA
jgi:hypothetical protein